MWKNASTYNPKLIEASNAIYMTYQYFSKDLKEFGFVEKVESSKKAFQLPQRAN